MPSATLPNHECVRYATTAPSRTSSPWHRLNTRIMPTITAIPSTSSTSTDVRLATSKIVRIVSADMSAPGEPRFGAPDHRLLVRLDGLPGAVDEVGEKRVL